MIPEKRLTLHRINLEEIIEGMTVKDSFIYNIRIVILSAAWAFMGSCVSIQEPVLGDSIADVDGNVYRTVTLGTQTWMIDNLKTTRYNDNSPVALLVDSASWTSPEKAGYCWYNHSDSLAKANDYGALYNWPAVNTTKLAPAGWHVPNVYEWKKMEAYVAMYYYISGSLPKVLASKTGWSASVVSASVGNDKTKNNSSEFDAKPAGFRTDSTAVFAKMNEQTYWWTSQKNDSVNANYISISYNLATVEAGYKKYGNGFSVRCVKDSI